MCSQEMIDLYANLADEYFDESDIGGHDSNESEYLNSPEIIVNNKRRNNENVNERCAKRKKRDKASYKHIPHSEKPPHLVARRNARERKRVQAVNSAFTRLRKVVPVENRSKRLSKVKTLQRAIEYINNLMDLLEKANEMETDSLLASSSLNFSNLNASVESSVKSIPEKNYELIVNKENVVDTKWLQYNGVNSTFNGYENEMNIYYQRCDIQPAINLDSDVNDIQKNYYYNYFVNAPPN